MKILIVGGGGREHALAWKIKQSPLVKQLYAAPGNPGIASIGKCVPIQVGEIIGLAKFAKDNKIDFTVVGPEFPLAMGIVDEFEKRDLKIFGPNQKAAQIEADKSFAKDFMYRYGIPTAKFKVFYKKDAALSYIKTLDFPVVIKASGLAYGKGVSIVKNRREADMVIDDMLIQKKYGEAGQRIIIEEFLSGPEVTILVLTDGRSIKILPSAQDHKRLLPNDQGPNTGGMGSFSPYLLDRKTQSLIENVIIRPTILALLDNGIVFKGCLYFGLILTSKGPKVLEYNCRFGDPEAQSIIPLISSDIIPALIATTEDRLDEVNLEFKNKMAICFVLASAGYPGYYETGKTITLGTTDTSQTLIFHAGTKLEDKRLVTAGGRVLNVVGIDDTLKLAKIRALNVIKKIHFDGMYYRPDIGATGMRKVRRRRKKKWSG